MTLNYGDATVNSLANEPIQLSTAPDEGKLGHSPLWASSVVRLASPEAVIAIFQPRRKFFM